MIGIILTCIFGLILIDFLLVGILPSALKIWPKISGLGPYEKLMEGHLLWANTNMQGKNVDSMINKRVGYQSAVLTQKHFFLRLNRFNYLIKIETSLIESIEINKGILGRTLTLWFSQEGKKKYFKIKSMKLNDWIASFEKVGIQPTEIQKEI